MKYWISRKKGVMRLIAVILAVSLALSNEMVAFDVVSASYIDSSHSSVEDTADSQDSIQDNSDNGQTATDAPSMPDDPDDSDYSGNSDDSNQIEVSSNPVDSENPAEPEDKEDLENPEGVENPDAPEDKEDLENSEGVENPVAPEDKDDLENSEGLENPDAPEDKEDLENPEGLENPDASEDKEDLENSEGLENPDAPEDKEEPENSEGVENPDAPENKEDIADPESPGNFENTEESEDSNTASLAEGDYGEASQSGSCGSNLTWTYYADTKTLVISGTGEMSDYLGSNQWKDITDIEHLIVEEGVTSIGGSAFAGKTGLVGEIRLPQSLTTVGGNAFKGCSGITKVIFADGDGESRTLEFGERAFEGCSSLKTIRFPKELTGLKATGTYTYFNCNNLTELTIPGGLGHITTNMGFSRMTALTKITVEDGITAIDRSALPKGNLEEIRLPDGLEGIPDSLFNGASKLTRINPTEECDVNLPAGIGKIEASAFYGCEALTGEVRLPVSVTTIGTNAFNSCSGITKVVFADGDGESRALVFGDRAFDGCSSLETIRFPKELTGLTATGNYTYLNCDKLTELTIPGGLGQITTNMGFSHMSALTKITVGDGITAINTGALPKGNLEEIWLPDSLGEISNNLFYGASGLVRINPTEECDINLPAGIRKIGSDAFRSCSSLAGEVRFPVSLTTVGTYAFYDCSKITKVVFADGDGESRTLEFGNYAFNGCGSLETIRFPKELTELIATGSNTYSYCNNLTEVIISGGLKHITINMGFSRMTALTKITVEDGITAIDKGALYTRNLEEIRLPDGLEGIPDNLFFTASNLARINPTEECDVNLPAGIRKIGSDAFNGCTALAGEVRLPASVETIGTNAFSNCSGITKVVFADGDGESRTLEFGNYAFNGCSSLETIRFPQELTGLTTTGGGTYSSCNNLTEIIIPGGLKHVTTSMGFQGMTALKKITVEDGIAAIDTGALPKNNLEEIWLPDSLGEISNSLFLNASKLVRINPTEECGVNLPAGIGKIEASAFNGCSSLAGEVRLSAGVETIGTNAFNGCSGITKVAFADGDGESRTLEFGNYAFSGCRSLETIRFPQELTGLTVTGGSTYSSCNNLSELTIPGGLKHITANMGFQGMNALKKITVEDGITAIDRYSIPTNNLEEIRLPDSLEEISDGLFFGAAKLVQVNPTEECKVNLPAGIGRIGDNAFNSCSSLAGEVRVPVGVTTVGKSAFSGCREITKVVFADGVGQSRTLEFCDYAFNSCSSLETIRFPQELTELTATGGSTYYGSNNLTELIIPGSLKHITTNMGFQRMTALKKITVEDGITAIDGDALPKNNLEEIRLPDSLEEISVNLFLNASRLARINPTEECGVNLPTGIGRIGEGAFRGCAALAGEVRVPVGVTTVGYQAFYNCSGITKMVFADGDGESRTLEFGDYAFNGCSSLETIRFPKELTELKATGGWTYYNCGNLTELIIPGSLKHIDQDMGFQRMTALTKITVEDGITAIDGDALPKRNLEEIRLPDDLEEISDSLFLNAANLVRMNPTEEQDFNLPAGLRRIGSNAFYGCKALAGELRIPAGVSEIGRYAFRECEGFAELYLPDGLCTLGDYAFDYCYGLTAVHTGLMPVYRGNGSSIFDRAPIREVWFRGTDGGTVAEMDGIGNADWSMLMRYSQLYQTSTLYIDDTVNRLTDQAFWGNYADVRFVGPNVVTLEKTNGENIFSATSTPLRDLEGVFYVTQEGALYALNPASGTAALAYCPPGITELYIPSTVTATEEMTADSRYARSYRVTGVTQHAVMAATDLMSVTAANPRQIVLSTHAFADCPTLSSVNGVTTRKEAGALFGPNGTPAIKKAFVNTGLEEGGEESSGRGKPMRSLTYINPNVGKLTVNIRRTSGTLEYRDDTYQLLTGEGVAFDLKAEAYGASTLYAPFRLYFEPSDLTFTGMKTGTQTYRITSNGTTHLVKVKTVYDGVSGCYCVSFNLPAGVTWEWKGIADTDGETVMYPLETRGGGLCVWGEVLDFTDAESGGEEEDEVFGGFSGDNNYMLTAWDTKRNHYELNLVGKDNKAVINSNTHRPAFNSHHGGLAISAIFRDGIRDNATNMGKDPVTAIRYHYTVTLPEGMTWAEEETILQNVSSSARVKNVISVSADRRELVYEFEQSIANRNDILGVTYQRLWFGVSGSPTSSASIQVGEDYDFYRDLGQKIEYKCRATIYYQFSEPDETQEVTAYEYLKPTDEGVVELKRQYEFPSPSPRGRGLPMKISFVAENKGENPASVNLLTITEEVLNESSQNDKHNGYLYLTEGQMADVILGESGYLEIQNIEITQAALYRGRAYESEISHIGTDGRSEVRENLLNTYTEPTEANARIVLTVNWPDSESGEAGVDEGETQGRRPVGLSISVNGGVPREIPFSADRAELAKNIKEALEEAGYLIPTGLYRLTWNATDAARERIVGPYTDTVEKSYLWTIGSYQATVKPDYLQGHRFLTSDSLGNYRYLFTDSYYRRPTAQAVFTLQNGSGGEYQTTDSVRDTAYEVSRLELHATGIDSRTGEEILTENSGEQWLCPGVVLSWRVDFYNGNYSEFKDIPFMQTLDRYQCLLAPVVSNPALADQGYETITFRDKEYYMLKPAEGEQQIQGLWLDDGDAGGNFYADSVTVAGGGGTQIRWYEKSVGPRLGGDDTREYRFFTYVLAPESSKERPTAASVVYANNYKSSSFSTRIYNYYNIGYQRESIHKDIITNPEAVGTEEEKTAGDQRTSYLGAGTSVTYRLSFDEYWIGDYTLGAGEIYDMLPCTYGLFEWKLNENVQVKYALRERVARDGQTAGYEPYLPEDGADFARIDLVEEPINGTGDKIEQYRLSFGEFTIPYNRTLYIYVTLTFPEEQAVWDSFAEAADEYLYNIVWFQDLRSSVLHMVARPTQAFLKTGMYGTEGDPYGYVYSNSDEKDRIIKYYLVLYNHGKSFLYLNPVHIKIPEGFTLKAPPKVYMNTGLPNWNLTDVSVLDEDPPAKISRMDVSNVKVTYAEENEAVLDILIEEPWHTYVYDELVGKYFLRSGQYVAVELRMEAGGYQETPDAISLPAAMPIDDSFRVGRIAQVQGVDAHRSGYSNSNEGIPEFWESDEIAAGRGFRDPSPSDTGKWVASEMRLIREEANPGVTKGAPVLKRVAQGETPYDPQEGAAMEHPVKWETRLVNGGSNSLTDFRVKDSVQWPYVFEGEVKLTSQIGAVYDKKFTITRYASQIISEGGDMVEQIDRDKLKIGEQEVRIADSRQEAFEEDSGCSATVFRNVKVYFYKEDAFGDGHLAETMEFDFTQDRDYGVGPASYRNGKVVENSRVLSYWTKFDLSRKNEATRSSYANRMIMEPEQPYTKADVSQGIAIDRNGEPVQNGEETPAGIMAMGYVSVNAGQSTAAWMKVKENKKAGEEDQEPEITDDIREMLTRENKIIQGDVENTVTYTLNVLNHVANPNDTVVSADDRKYSIQNMVIINTLPYLGDKMPFNSKVPRSSDFGMIPDRDSFNLTLYYYNAEEDAGQETDIPEDKLHPLPEDCYQILYNESTDVEPRDWLFNENSAPGWNTEIPDWLSDGWKTADELGDITKARSFRIEIKDPNKVFDPANPSVYRSLMSAGCTVVVKYQARVQTGLTEDGKQTPTPGQCAWNSFGYRFDRFDGGAPMEASSIRTGVQIPAIPILYEKLIDYDQNPYVNQGEPQKFTFTIDKEAEEKEDGTTRPAQQLKFTVTVGTGQSENNRELLNIRNLEPEIIWWKEAADDDSFFWEDGATYIVKQTGAPAELPRFSIKVNGQQTTEFVYDALYEPVIVVTNQSRVWSSQLFKMDSESRGWDPTDDKDREQINFLSGALFGLYTTDKAQQIDIAAIREEAGSRYEWWQSYQSILQKMMEVVYGDDPDTAVKLYLKDFCVTDANGEIRWQGLEDDKYYVRELDPPEGFRLSETFYPISRRDGVLSVYNDPGLRLPVTGGGGTLPFYIGGVLILLANTILAGRRRRRKRKIRKE